MKPAQSIDVVARSAPRSGARALEGFGTDTALLRLQRALAHVEDLKRKLASTEQELFAVQQERESLIKANSQLRELAVRRGDQVACSTSRSSSWRLTACLSAGLDSSMTEHIDQLLTTPFRFRRCDYLFRAGDESSALYVIDIGSCKTALLASGGQIQVAGYHLAGEMVGIDSIGTKIHNCEAVALEDMEVYMLPFDRIEALARLSGAFQHNLHKMMSDEVVRAQRQMILLGTLRAGQRVAAFLLDLSKRYEARGYSSREFLLRTTREEIGSYLGLKLETVSRTLGRFQHDGLIQVQGRSVKLLDRVALSRFVEGS